MNQWKVDFSVNGKRTQQVVTCNSSIDAKQLIEVQYPNCQITFWGGSQRV